MVFKIQKRRFWRRWHASQRTAFWIQQKAFQGTFEGGWPLNKPWIGQKRSCDHKTILSYLNSIEFAQKLGSWVPPELKESQKENRLQIASQDFARHKKRFFYRIIKYGRWKMVPIRKHEAKKEWVAPWGTPKPRVKSDLHPKKTMACVSWDWEGMVHWEMLERNVIVNKELYIAQLHRAKELFDWKEHRQGRNILLHDNARPQVAEVVKAVLQELEREVLQHPP